MLDANYTTATRIAKAVLALLILTTVHHLYGGYIFSSPERYHIAFAAAPIAVVIAAALWAWRALGVRLAWYALGLPLAVLTVAAIGGFEGVYNHVLKNLLFFAGTSYATLDSIYLLYEPPSDVIFEVTGIAQAALGGLAGWHIARALRDYTRARRSRFAAA